MITAIEKYGNEVDFIICSWIPYGSDAGKESLIKIREVNPELKMIYIGEMGASCANDKFVETCEIIDNEFVKRANLKFKSWFGIHDRIYMLK
ncbi:hypothetical protein [Lacrimispora amygdalina]|uniref:hypothetical protein n=1 Tax=Lacrimispora amygdalina TaxID=253257 RepID=UPI000BE2FFEF|nr:hypothetical protein [Lacrimispora amygdalina]